MRRRWQLASSWFMAHGAYKAFGGAFGSFAQDTTSQGAFSWHRHICDRRYRSLIESSGSCHERLLPPFAHTTNIFTFTNLVESESPDYRGIILALTVMCTCCLDFKTATEVHHSTSPCLASPRQLQPPTSSAKRFHMVSTSSPRTGHLPNATLYDRSELTPVN